MTVVNSIASAFSQITPSGMSPLFFWGSFIFVYAIAFSALGKMKSLFGDNTALISVISLVIALMVALSPVVSQVISTSLPSVGILVVFFVCVLLAVNLIVPGWEAEGKSKKVLVLFIFIFIAFTFIVGAGIEIIYIGEDYVALFGYNMSKADLELVMAIGIIAIPVLLISVAVMKKGGKG